jgi:hypothetical protein
VLVDGTGGAGGAGGAGGDAALTMIILNYGVTITVVNNTKSDFFASIKFLIHKAVVMFF